MGEVRPARRSAVFQKGLGGRADQFLQESQVGRHESGPSHEASSIAAGRLLRLWTFLRRRFPSDRSDLSESLSAPRPAWQEASNQQDLTPSALAELLGHRFEVAAPEEVLARIGDAPVILVINRSIITLDRTDEGLAVKRAPGGAATASHDALVRAGGGVVISTATTDLERRIAQCGVLVSPGQNIWIHYLQVPQETFSLFYNEFANPALWLIQHEMGDKILPRPSPRDWLRHPQTWLGHYLPWTRVEAIHQIIFTEAVDRAYREGYQRVNRQYAEAITAAYGELMGAKILIQDYHFYLLPQYLRDLGCKALLDHFIHIPWVSHRYLQAVMPEALWRELLTSLLQNDVLGFQTPGYSQRFIAAARTLLGARADIANGIVTYHGHDTLVQAYPISVDVGQLRRTALAGAEGAATLQYVHGLRRKLGRKLLIVRADRVDLSKGIIEGFEALNLMLTRNPGLGSHVQMLSLLQRSRLNVPEYRDLFERTKNLVRDLNAKWSPNATWDGIIETGPERNVYLCDLADPTIREWPLVVVDFFEKPYTEVVGAQIAADIGLVNPLADGMNLVAKEFAVNNKPSFIRDFNQRLRKTGPGGAGVIPAVIIGSRRMGAYSELKEGLLSVDPRSIPETADVILRAVRMQAAARGIGLEEKRRLINRLGMPLRRVLRRRLPGDVLADRAAEQVSRSTITDWMDKLLLDVELVRDPLWARAVRVNGLTQARGAIERGLTLAEAFPNLGQGKQG